MIIFTMDLSAGYSLDKFILSFVRCKTIGTNGHHVDPELKVTSSNDLVCPSKL